jgi:hypothetical protein
LIIWDFEKLKKSDFKPNELKTKDEKFIRSCLLMENEKKAIVCGESKYIKIFDLETSELLYHYI